MKFQNISIAKIEFLWRALNFKRGHGPPGPPFSAAYAVIQKSHQCNTIKNHLSGFKIMCVETFREQILWDV